MQVSQVMTRNVATTSMDASLRDVARMMIDKDCGAIPVVDESGRPLGIVTDRDIVCRTLGLNKDPNQSLVSDCMSAKSFAVELDADVDECCDVMEENKIRRVMVVDEEGKCCGIVAQADIATHTSKRKAGEVVQVISKTNGRSNKRDLAQPWSSDMAHRAKETSLTAARRSRNMIRQVRPMPAVATLAMVAATFAGAVGLLRLAQKPPQRRINRVMSAMRRA